MRVLASLALLSSVLASGAVAQNARVDAYGDRLAPGVIARFGSPRMLHDAKITAIRLSESGDVVASGTQGGTVHVWSAIDGRSLFEKQLAEGGVRSLALSANGERVAAGSTQGYTVVWDVPTRVEIVRIDGGELVDLSPDASVAAVAGADDGLKLVKLEEDGALDGEGSGYLPTTLSFSPDGAYVVKTSWNRERVVREGEDADPAARLEVFRVDDAKSVWHTTWTDRDLRQPAFARGGAELLVREPSGDLVRFATATGERLGAGPTVAECVYAVAAGERVAALSAGGVVSVWKDASSESEEIALGDDASACALSIDGTTLAFGVGREVLVHDVETGKRRALFDRHVGPVGSVAFTPDGAVLVTGGYDGDVRLWETGSGLALNTLVFREQRVFAVDVSADGELVASADFGGRVRVWNVTSGELVREFYDADASFTSLDFSPVGNDLACVTAGGEVRVMDARTGDERQRIGGFVGSAHRIAWAPDGRRIAVGARDLVVIDAETGDELRRWTRLGSPLGALTWNPDGTRVAAGFAAKLIRLYDPSSEAPEFELKGHAGRVTSVAFSADGSELYSTSYSDPLVRIWNPASGELVRTLASPGGELLSVQPSPDGKALAVGGLNPISRLLSLR